jgi:hypothetical protein
MIHPIEELHTAVCNAFQVHIYVYMLSHCARFSSRYCIGRSMQLLQVQRFILSRARVLFAIDVASIVLLLIQACMWVITADARPTVIWWVCTHSTDYTFTTDRGAAARQSGRHLVNADALHLWAAL